MRSIALALVTALLFAAPASAATPPAGGNPAADAVERFGHGLFQKLVAEDKGQNVFVSAASVTFALAMTAKGARGETKAELDAMLGLAGLDAGAVDAAFRALIAGLADADPKVKLAIADAIYVKTGLTLLAPFRKAVETIFSAEVNALDFDAAGSVKVVNDWCAKKTNDKIPELLKTFPSNTVMVLLNAIYFKGDWAAKFDPAQTRERDFFPAGGAAVKKPLMERTGEFAYVDAAGLQVIRLPYGNGRLAMYVFLPPKGTPARDWLAKADRASFADPIDRMEKGQGTIALPKFEIAYEKTLNEILKALGMKRAFVESAADFSGMLAEAKGRVFVGLVLHKSYCKVNEEGTEAAAVTAVVERTKSFHVEPPPFSMVVDRPFLFIIRDDQTGTPLFHGLIEKP